MKYLKYIATLLLLALVGIVLLNFNILKSTRSSIYSSIEEVPTRQVALVLGARVYINGQMSSILADRVKTALELYQAGKVEKFLLSGDHGRVDYDEVNAMKDYLLENQVSSADIFLDHAGFDTYDSLYRAQKIFEVNNLVIVTQEFHLPRAIYLARELGLDVVGLKADRQQYLYMKRNNLREFLARVKAFIDIISKSKSKFGGEVISIDGDGQASWD